MSLTIVGPSPYGQGSEGVFKPRVATIFPRGNTLLTAGTHYDQHTQFLSIVDRNRQEQGLPPLTGKQRDAAFLEGVDLIIHPNTILIRPDPQQLDLMFEADELLQELASKLRIRFMLAGNPQVYEAIKRRGECWRISPVTVTTEDMISSIRNSRMALGGRPIYYHSASTGTRMLTIQSLRELAELPDDALRQHLLEIQEFSARYNRKRQPEVDFFLGSWPLRKAFKDADFEHGSPSDLRAQHSDLSQQFAESVHPDLRQDDPGNADWMQEMYRALCPLADDMVNEAQKLGLASEFHMHVEWLPGGRIEDGLLVFDPIYKVIESQRTSDEDRLKDQRARQILFNFVRDNPDLEYINAGRIVEPLSRGRRKQRGRREVYIFEMKQRGQDKEIVKIVRIQKWDVGWRLDQGVPFEQAMIDTEEYTEYTLDRRLGCRRLGMNLDGQVVVGKIGERYQGNSQLARGRRVWTPYFERDYVRGIASDKIPRTRFETPEYTHRFAELLGRAAASNLIVGRGDLQNEVFFDDGDEVIIEDAKGMPVDLVVTHHTGSFWHFKVPLQELAPAYAHPVLSRAGFLPDRDDFARVYLAALVARFEEIQRMYREKRGAFDQLFHFRDINPAGNFAFRWACVLERLENTDAQALGQAIVRHIQFDQPA
jgi:hypothetical protein